MPSFPFERVLNHGEKFEVENNVTLEVMQIDIVQLVAGWTKPIKLLAYYDFFGAETMSVDLWTSERVAPHSVNVKVEVDGLCEFGPQGAKVKIYGKLINKSIKSDPAPVVQNDDSCVLL